MELVEGLGVLKIAETVARERLELKKAQVTYKKTFDRSMRRGNANIKSW